MMRCISAICSRPKPLSASPCNSLARVSGALQRARSSASSLKNSGSLPNSISINCCGPRFPAVGFVEDEGVFIAVEGSFVGLVLFQAVEVLQKQQPRGLL